MSTATTSIDPKAHLTAYLRRVGEMYLSDLGHIPEERLASSPMGCARSPLEFTAECAGYNMMATKVLRGEPMEAPSPEDRKAFYASIDTPEKARHLFRQSVEDLAAAIDAADPEILTNPVTAPWGQEMRIFDLLHSTASHISYHDGQLNYIQCLYGDAENHWM